MDQYISIFEELVNEANYDIDSKPVMNLFQKGLNYKLNSWIFSFFPAPQNWGELKAMAIRAFNAEGNLKAFHDNPFGRGVKGARGHDRSFGDQPPSRQYNSTNAPPSYNNQPVPMDMGRAKGWRRSPTQGNAATPAQGNTAPAKDGRPQCPPKFQGDCWHCQKPGHTMKGCRKLQREKAATTT